MGVSTWHYLVGNDGLPRRLTQKVVADLRNRGGARPEYASQRRKIIVVDLVANRRAPPLLIRAVGRYWYFDEKGSLSAQLWQEQVDIGNLLPGALQTRPDERWDREQENLRQEFIRQEIVERTIWRPSDVDMEPVIRDIWHMPLSKWRTLNLEVPAERH